MSNNKGSENATPNVKIAQVSWHSSRIQDNGTTMLEKAMNKKVAAMPKGNLTISKPSNTSSNNIELVSQACGIYLGQDDNSRLATISLIQARVKAMEALLKARNKVTLNSDDVSQQDLEIMNEVSNTDGLEVADNQRSDQVEVSVEMSGNLSNSIIK